MSKLKTFAFVAAAILAAAATGGIVGGGAAVALVRIAYNGPTGSPALPEVLVNSAELGEPMTLRVHLPIEYDEHPDEAFPVIWVLDGPAQGPRVASMVQTLSRAGVSTPSIVVEVPSSSRGRRADFTPPWPGSPPDAQGDRFYAFLESEALPAIAGTYRAGGTAILVGHSLGGLFALHALLQEPAPFDGYFALSPSVWVDDERILEEVRGAATSGRPQAGALFVSIGSEEGNEMRSGFEALTALLGSWPAPGLRWTATITEGADHGTNPELSFPVAAQWYAAR